MSERLARKLRSLEQALQLKTRAPQSELDLIEFIQKFGLESERLKLLSDTEFQEQLTLHLQAPFTPWSPLAQALMSEFKNRSEHHISCQ